MSLCRLASHAINATSTTIATPISTSAQVSVPLEVSSVAVDTTTVLGCFVTTWVFVTVC